MEYEEILNTVLTYVGLITMRGLGHPFSLENLLKNRAVFLLRNKKQAILMI